MSMLCASPYRAPKVRPPIETDLWNALHPIVLESYDNQAMIIIALSVAYEDPLNNPTFVLPAIDETLYYYYIVPLAY